jgi:hypothetical protein
LHGSAGGENADGEQWYHLAKANGAADLEGSRQQLGIEPRRASPRCERESGALCGTALRPERVAKGENRDQQEDSAKPKAGNQRIVSSREPDEGRNQQEYESDGGR